MLFRSYKAVSMISGWKDAPVFGNMHIPLHDMSKERERQRQTFVLNNEIDVKKEWIDIWAKSGLSRLAQASGGNWIASKGRK
jgi:hypothetical protein